MKKLTSIILVIACLLSLTACTSAEESAARAAVEGFLNAYVTADFEGMKAFVDDASALPENLDADKVVDELMAELPQSAASYEDDLREAYQHIIDKIAESLSYEITGVVKNDGEFTYTVKVTAPDPEADFQQMMGDKLSEEAVNDMVSRMLSEGKIDLESPQEEILEALMPEMIKMVSEAFDEIEIKTITSEEKIVVTKKDGKWLINMEKSTLSVYFPL